MRISIQSLYREAMTNKFVSPWVVVVMTLLRRSGRFLGIADQSSLPYSESYLYEQPTNYVHNSHEDTGKAKRRRRQRELSYNDSARIPQQSIGGLVISNKTELSNDVRIPDIGEVSCMISYWAYM